MRQTTKFGGLLLCIFRHNVGSSVHLLFILRNSNAIILILKTVFANIFNETDQGYLILRKTDDRKVWVIYLDSFEPGTWTHIDSKDKSYGSYDIYYHEGWHFERHISSVKWGKWWMGKDLPSLSKNW